MKKTLIILLIMACLSSSSACTNTVKLDESVSSIVSVESTKESEATTSEVSASESLASSFKETTETTMDTTTTEALTTSTVATTQTTKPKSTVKVSTATKKTITVEGNKFKVSIPKVTITDKNTSAVNKKIKKDVNKKKWGASYSYYADDKIVSILIHYQGMYDADEEYRVYNVSVSTGKFMSDSAVVKLAGSTDKKFLAQVKKAYKKDKFGTKYGLSKKRASNLLSKIRKRNLKRVSYKYVDPYIDSKGKLKWVSSHYWYNLEADDIELVHT